MRIRFDAQLRLLGEEMTHMGSMIESAIPTSTARNCSTSNGSINDASALLSNNPASFPFIFHNPLLLYQIIFI